MVEKGCFNPRASSRTRDLANEVDGSGGYCFNPRASSRTRDIIVPI